MEGFFAGVAGRHMFGGRMYRDRDEFRRYYRERAGIGGFFGHLLDSKEFELFLCLLTGLICLNVTRDHLMTSPITSMIVLGIVFLQFESWILGEGNTVITPNNFHNYSFHPNRIMNESQYIRLFTGPMLHTSKLHMYLNITALVGLCQVEAHCYRSNNMTVMQYAMFMVLLIGLAGIMHCVVANKYKPSACNTFSTGFSGVIFALKTAANCNMRSHTSMSFPIVGDAV